MPQKSAVKRAQVRMSCELYHELEKRAKAQNLSVYNYGGDLLEKALIYEAKEASDELLAPHIRKAVRQELNWMIENISDLLIRIYLEAGTSRRLNQASMMVAPRLSREKILEITERNWENTYKELHEDIKGIEDWQRLVPRDSPQVQSQNTSQSSEAFTDGETVRDETSF